VTDDMHVVLDDSAMVAARSGNVLVPRLIHRAHTEAGWYLLCPGCEAVSL
jgi:hypothetical protein